MMEKTGYTLLSIVGIIWLVLVIVGMVGAYPWGLIGFIALIGFGVLFVRVLADRLENREDDHYSRNVDK
ncbi:MAG: hypothetical protein QF492_08725 [Candidatus Krumholzibacteria bacterium]|jgi:F0F1-type ATP synthase assembly protein I|nr:hypothetical protein [Candidatus Krumholzibacteria bacterium]MDP6669971.1 hypothetical protein [Candidatus Krumholzibacteria bacterium]MDP6797157.1 hypothetical protein [Candidatus Krumholzibacteria bacterium]MDP7022527.1 hypothetical protein [Candidatus Krumholzibacteria bacterium]